MDILPDVSHHQLVPESQLLPHPPPGLRGVGEAVQVDGVFHHSEVRPCVHELPGQPGTGQAVGGVFLNLSRVFPVEQPGQGVPLHPGVMGVGNDLGNPRPVRLNQRIDVAGCG